MIAEPTTATYTDNALSARITLSAVLDERGVNPWTWNYATTPPSHTANTDWVETYDLNAVAAVIWGEKASAAVGAFEPNIVKQYLEQASRYRSKSCPGSLSLVATMRATDQYGDVVEVAPIIDRFYNLRPFNS